MFVNDVASPTVEFKDEDIRVNAKLEIYPDCAGCEYGHVDYYYGDFDCDMDIKYGHCPFECHIESITFNGKDIIENLVEN